MHRQGTDTQNLDKTRKGLEPLKPRLKIIRSPGWSGWIIQPVVAEFPKTVLLCNRCMRMPIMTLVFLSYIKIHASQETLASHCTKNGDLPECHLAFQDYQKSELLSQFTRSTPNLLSRFNIKIIKLSALKCTPTKSAYIELSLSLYHLRQKREWRSNRNENIKLALWLLTP